MKERMPMDKAVPTREEEEEGGASTLLRGFGRIRASFVERRRPGGNWAGAETRRATGGGCEEGPPPKDNDVDDDGENAAHPENNDATATVNRSADVVVISLREALMDGEWVILCTRSSFRNRYAPVAPAGLAS
jgi:hypothetical protein